jgi:hypothetical protein|tara:strand:- start:148 stop:891 length:744 start_codon:yes stop_codon:yes gene_type:complete
MFLFLSKSESDQLAKPTLETLTSIYCTTVGRDKTWKFVQNFSRFLFYILTTISGNKRALIIAEIFRNLWKNLSNVRKGFRLGKSITHANKFRITYLNPKRTRLYKGINCFKRSILFFHEFFDNLFWFCKFIVPNTKNSKIYKQYAYLTKGMGEGVGLCLHYTELQRINALSTQADVDHDDLSKQRAKLLRGATKSTCDVIGVFFNAGFSLKFGLEKNDGVLGLLGCLSAVMTLIEKYPREKTKKKLK